MSTSSDQQQQQEPAQPKQPRKQQPQQYRAKEPLYIALSGLIGAGKTTLAKELGRVLKLKVYHEPVADNPYLADFYGDMAQHGFAMQIYLLNERFRQQQAIVWNGRGAVQDRSIYEDKVFAAMLRDDGIISERDYATYEQLFTNMAKFMSRPTLLVYLDITPYDAYERIMMRGRACEGGITMKYLTKLHASYERFISEIAKTVQVLRVDYSQFQGADEMARVIQAHVRSMGRAAIAKPRRIKCYNCNKYGHKSKECELPQRRKRKEAVEEPKKAESAEPKAKEAEAKEAEPEKPKSPEVAKEEAVPNGDAVKEVKEEEKKEPTKNGHVVEPDKKEEEAVAE